MPNPFLESWYLLPSLREFDPHGAARILCLEHEDALAGLFPVSRQNSYYSYPLPHLRGWGHANSFCGAPLVAKGSETAFWRALFEWADRNARSALFLHLAQIPLEGALYEALLSVLADQDRAAALVHREERAMLDSGLSAEEYFNAAIKSKRRSEIARKQRRLSECGELTITRQDDSTGIAEWIERFLALEASGWKGKAGSALASDPRNAALFRNALFGAASRGRLERVELALDGRPVAMLTTFLTAPGAYGFKTAFDDEFSRFSPGVLAQRENLNLLDRADIDWCDSCSAENHPMIDHFWRERRPIGRISIAIGGSARRATFAAIARAEKGTML